MKKIILKVMIWLLKLKKQMKTNELAHDEMNLLKEMDSLNEQAAELKREIKVQKKKR